MRLPEQVTRIALVMALLVAAILVLRFAVIPGGYFSTAEHEASTIRRVVAQPIGFAGQAACEDCHSEVVEKKAGGYHRGLACETCHGPSAKHAAADDPETLKPYAPRDRKFCPTCHAYDAARPTGFPQINPEAHNPLRPCFKCHDPHDPVPPETPKECSACHAQIARTISLSSHALLPCATCHEASEQHRTQPRSALPTKPQAREFCGKCHATDASNPDAPKVEMASHGATYLCWQCHYPHMPEGR